MIRLIFALSLFFSLFAHAQHGTPAGEKITRFEREIQNASRRHGVKSAFIKGIIRQESNFKPRARSHAGAMGLMQLMPGTAKDMGVQNAYHPQQNVYGGTKYINRMLKMFYGNPCLALAAYNWGPGNMRKLIRRKGTTDCKALIPFMPKETQQYIVKVTRYTKEYGLDLGVNSSELESAAGNSTSGDDEYVPKDQQTRFEAFYEKLFTKVDFVVNVQKFFLFVSMQAQVVSMLNVLLTLWVFMLAYQILRKKITSADLIYKSVRTIFMLSLAVNFIHFYRILGEPLSNASLYYLNLIFPDSSSVGESLDLFAARFAEAISYQLQTTNNTGNEIILTATYHIFNWLMSIYSGAYSLAKIGHAICYFFAPLAIILYLFEATKNFTTRWLQLFLFFVVFEIIITFILYFMFGIGMNTMSTVAYQNLSDYLEPLLLFTVTALMLIDAARFSIALAGGQDLIFPGLLGRNAYRNTRLLIQNRRAKKQNNGRKARV